MARNGHGTMSTHIEDKIKTTLVIKLNSKEIKIICSQYRAAISSIFHFSNAC